MLYFTEIKHVFLLVLVSLVSGKFLGKPHFEEDYKSDGLLVDYPLTEPADIDVIEDVDLSGNVAYISHPGTYRISAPGRATTCGIYIIGAVDGQVELKFEEFSVNCQSRGVVEIVDGYAHGKSVFPPAEDLQRRFISKTFCGSVKPVEKFRSTANMALIQLRLPTASDGFVIEVVFVRNPKPCNAVALSDDGNFKLQNYGAKVNCSILFLFPETVTVEFLDVGTKPTHTSKLFESFRSTMQVHLRGSGDYLEILGGNMTSLLYMTSFKHISGFNPFLEFKQEVTCDNVMVRLISSGSFDNLAQIRHEVLDVKSEAGQSNLCFRKNS